MGAFSDWCCKLTGNAVIQGYGVIVQFAGNLTASSLLPGLKKAGEIKSKYALLTCHSIIPGSEESFKRISWSLKSKATGSTKSLKLNSFVSGAISCCGKKSLFGPGEYTLIEHQDKVCTLGLDFTLLFLDSKFESYITANPPKCRPPIVTIPQSEAHLQEFSEALRTCSESGSNSTASSLQSTNERSKISGTFFISLPTIDTDATNQSPRLPVLVTSAKDSIDSQTKVLKLNQDIAKYEAVKRISCTHIGNSTTRPSPGMPIASQCVATSKLTGILVQSPNGLIGITVYGIAQLIQGGPVGCLSVLINQAADRLWANRWSYLILPYLEESVSLETRHVLEILQVFLEKKLLKANITDLLGTREAVLTLIGALFRHFKDVGQDELMKAIEDTFGVAAVKREFLGSLRLLCASVVENVNDANRYLSQQETTQLVKACFYAVAMMLNFNDREGIVSHELRNEGFLKTLEMLGVKYAETAAVQRDLASIHKKCWLDLQRNVKELATAHKQDVDNLQSDHAVKVTELEVSCSKVKEKFNRKEKECITYAKMVKLERAQSSNALKENQKLKEDIQQLQQCLSSEQAVREREQRLSCELDQEKTKVEEKSREIAKLCDKVSVLEDRCRAQEDSVHRTNTDLAQSNRSVYTQTKQLAEMRGTIQTLTQQVEKLKMEKTQQREELENKASDLQKQNEILTSQLKKQPTAKPESHSRHGSASATPPRPHSQKISYRKVTSTPTIAETVNKSTVHTHTRQRTSLSDSKDVSERPKSSARRSSDSAMSRQSTKTPKHH